MEAPCVVGGSAHRPLAVAVAAQLGCPLAASRVQRFPDGELEVELDPGVRGRTVFVLQPLGPPCGEPLLELLLLADACHRAGAAAVVAVLPYLGYARQDRVVREGQPLGARVVARALGTASFRLVVAVDVHSPVLTACLESPVVHLTAVPVLLEALRRDLPADAVVVAPDLGAVKLAESYARPLGLPVITLHKRRLSGTEVAVRSVVGEVRGRRPILVDDMISTGATLEAAAEALLAAGCRGELTVAATHGLFAEGAAARLGHAAIVRCLVTDSLPPPPAAPARFEAVPLAPLLAEAIRRLLEARPLAGLLAAR